MRIDTRKPIAEIEKEIAEFFVPKLSKLIQYMGPGHEFDLLISRRRDAMNDFGDWCNISVRDTWPETTTVTILKSKTTPL